jgi:NAD(P)H-flavin reductase
VDLTPRPLLKRPFGVYRAFRRHFARDFLKRLELPPALAPALHLCFPDHFDMLYKVLPDGLGTNLMTKLKRGHKVHMVGPLGQPFDVRCLRAQGIEEVHVIGGGVGMAPLVLLVETLRYYAMPVKIFLGIATLESLRYRDELAATFGEKPRDAYIYIDDLLAAGVRPTDIYVSCDREAPEKVIRGIPEANLFHGLVPDQYRKFLAAHHLSVCHPERSEGSQSARAEDEILRSAQDDRQRELGVIMAFTCGPNRMMEIVSEICQAAGVRLKVLLEKRMGCGIGVCFSCVQKIRRPDGHDDYARICVEGPLFDAKDILWKNNDDSKQPSATSNCTARC